MEWKNAVVFISSSFNDMHAERDYLIKEVFPELTEWCEKYKIRLSDIDLRWGVSEEISQNKQTIEKCLDHIDKSRPFFLCFLGQRRGWIPDFDENISQKTKDKFENIEKEYDGCSATEMEIEYALLAPLYNFMRNKKCPPTKHSLFFLRDDSYLSDITPEQRKIYTNDALENPKDIEFATNESKKVIEEIKARKKEEDAKSDGDETKVHVEITDYGGTWNERLIIPELFNNPKYTDGEGKGRLTNFKAKTDDGEEELKCTIIRQLKEQLALAFPENVGKVVVETPLEKELNQQDNFCHINSEGYIERKDDIDRLKRYIADEDENKICLVSSKAGYGKTMFLANFATYLEEEYTNKFNESKENKKHIYKRFCGASDDSSRVLSLWQSIVEEAGIPTDFEYYPENLDALKRNIPYILDEIASKKDSVIIIDAVNQMPDGLNMLKWLSAPSAGNLKIIVSVKEDSENEKYDNQLKSIKKKSSISDNPDYCFELEAFESKEDKENLINKYLENYLKELSQKDIDIICEFPGSKNPLYLKILLAELRVFGSFEQLSDKIKSFGDEPKDAFKQVLARLEDDEQYSEADNVAALLFSLLANARYGLSEKELVSIISKERNAEGNEEKTNEIRNAIRLNLRQVRPFLARKEGRHDFFYESFKLAAQEKYGDNKIHANELLADYFMHHADSAGDLSFNPEGDSDDEKARPLNELPYHLNQAEKNDELAGVLSSYAFIKNKLGFSEIYNLISDYQFDQEHEFSKDDHPIGLIGRALELSAPILDNEKEQLPIQLWGRMNGIDDKVIEKLLNELDSSTSNKWLKSNANALYSPKSAIVKRIKPDGKKATTAIAMVNDNEIVIGSEDGILNIFNIEDNDMETLEEGTSKVIKIVITDEDTIVVANANGVIKEWDINNKAVTKEYPIIEAEITDIYISNTYQKIFASSHEGIFSINLETDEYKREDIESNTYNQILVPRRNEAILVCNEKEVDGWDVYEMRKAYNKQHQQNDEEESGSKRDSSEEIRFMGLNKRFLTLISENGQMKFWNTLKNSGGGESIAEERVCSPNDKFTQAKTLEDENRIVTISDMGVMRVWDIPQPRSPKFNKEFNEKTDKEIDIQTGIKTPTAIDYHTNGEDRAVIVGNVNNDVSFIDLNKKVEEDTNVRHSESVLSIKVDGNHMITASDNGEVFTWDFDKEEFINKYSNDFRCNSISYNRQDSKLILAGVKAEKDGRKTYKIASADITEDMWQANGNDETVMEVDEKINSEEVIDIAQSSSGIAFLEEKKLVNGSDETPFDKTATTLATKFDSGDVFVGFEDGSIAKYPEGLTFDSGIASPVTKINVSANKVIAGHKNGSVQIIDLDLGNGETLEAHEKPVTNLYVDESQIISLSEDNTIKFWQNNNCIYTYYLDIFATSVDLKDGKLVVGDTLGNVRFFEFKN